MFIEKDKSTQKSKAIGFYIHFIQWDKKRVTSKRDNKQVHYIV